MNTAAFVFSEPVAQARSRSPTSRFLTLDAMRGVAALFVCLSHFSQVLGGYYPRFAYLAVDLFFILSGFVIARAYDQRLSSSMSFAEFFWRRFTRLLPMLMLGAFLGAVSAPSATLIQRLLTFVLNSAALPTLPPQHNSSLMPYDPPLWSLFFELWVANLAYGLFYRFLRPAVLAIVVLIGAIGMVWTIHSAGWFNIGMRWSVHEALYGLSRVIWGFFSGIALGRMHGRFKIPYVHPAIILAIVAFCLCMPCHGRITRFVELALPIVVFPLLVWLGTSTLERRPFIGILLGEASYALYALHYPILTLLQPLAAAQHFKAIPKLERGVSQLIFAAVAVTVAWGIAKYVDEPAQRALRKIPAKS